MSALTYGDLPSLTGTAYPRPSLLCADCGETWSAERGDYFMEPDSAPLVCGCGGALALVVRSTRYDPWVRS